MNVEKPIPLRRLLVPLGAVLAFMILYDFLLPHLHRWVEPHAPGRGLRLLFLDYPKAVIEFILVVWFGVRLEGAGWKETLQRMGLSSLRFRAVVVGVLACLLGFGYVFLHAHLANARWEWRPRLVYFLPFLLVLTCFGEEVVYRGFFFRLVRRGRGYIAGACISGLLMVADHYYCHDPRGSGIEGGGLVCRRIVHLDLPDDLPV